MIEPKAIDLPNYGILECDLDKEMIDYLWNLVHSYSPNVKWDGRRLIEFENTDQKQFLLNDDEKLFEHRVADLAGLYGGCQHRPWFEGE